MLTLLGHTKIYNFTFCNAPKEVQNACILKLWAENTLRIHDLNTDDEKDYNNDNNELNKEDN